MRQADDSGDIGDGGRKHFDRTHAVCAEILAQHQIFRRITADGHFRRQQQARARCVRLLRGSLNFFGIALEIADRQVELGQS